MILLIDNYDSFTFNLVHAFAKLGEEVKVVRSDQVTVEECLDFEPTGIIIGPGPGTPQNAGISLPLIQKAHQTLPILGICLGHQCLSEAFGGTTIRAKVAVHGKTSPILHHNQGLFRSLPQGFQATRYHSLVTNPETLPACFQISAETLENEIMGIHHSNFSLYGVQFHPESITSEEGPSLLQTFIEETKNESPATQPNPTAYCSTC